MLGERGELCLPAWMPGAPSAKGPGHVGWGHDSVSPRWWAMGSGVRRTWGFGRKQDGDGLDAQVENVGEGCLESMV